MDDDFHEANTLPMEAIELQDGPPWLVNRHDDSADDLADYTEKTGFSFAAWLRRARKK